MKVKFKFINFHIYKLHSEISRQKLVNRWNAKIKLEWKIMTIKIGTYVNSHISKTFQISILWVIDWLSLI